MKIYDKYNEYSYDDEQMEDGVSVDGPVDFGNVNKFVGQSQNNPSSNAIHNGKDEDNLREIMASFDQQPAGFPDEEEDGLGQPMDEFLANAFGSDIHDSNQKGKPMMNSLQIGGLADDRVHDFEKGVFNFNSLTMIPTGGSDENISQKPNFESIGTFKGIRGLSNNMQGLSDLIVQPQEEKYGDHSFDQQLNKIKKK